MLFICIAIGFIAKKANLLPECAGKVMAKMETWIFCPALSFITMARFFTVDSLRTHGTNILLAIVCVSIALTLAIFLSRFFVKEKSPERGIYQYALAFANGGYVGDPLVQALYGNAALAYYKIFYLPFSIIIYVWGISILVPDTPSNKGVWKKLLNAPNVAMIVGMIFGLTGLGAHLPSFASSAITSLSACMGPVAMLLAGFTVANYSMKEMLLKWKVYIATGLRLVILPAILISVLFLVKELANTALDLNIGSLPLFLAFFATGGPLGLNTVVFPEAYGGNPKTGASMALISHTLCVISIPIMHGILIWLFGAPVF